MRLTMVGTFCEPPVAQMPEGLPEMYLPPEMFTVEGSTNYGSAVDVWMYGICCYAICTNNIPYIVSETGEGLEKLVSGEWDKESPHFTNLPEKVRNFILRLLVLDPAARPTFNELVNDPWFHN
jgi:serine/threonine protein kinase